MIIQPNAPGGGATPYNATAASMSNGDAIVLTHAAVPLDEPLDVHGTAVYTPGGTSVVSLTTWDSLNWTIPNLNTSGRTWIADGGATGHLSGAADSGVGAGCEILIAGTTYVIESLVLDGTGAGSITLSGAPGPDSPITWIRALKLNMQIEVTANSLGVFPTAAAWYDVVSTAAPGASLPLAMTGALDLIGAIGSLPAGTAIKAAFSIDGGVTWLYYDGLAWEPMTRADWATKGCLVTDVGGNSICDAGMGAPIPTAAWDALGGWTAGVYNEDIRFAFAFNTDGSATPTISQIRWQYYVPAGPMPVSIGFAGIMMGGPQIRGYRRTTTQLVLEATTTLTDVSVTVWV
jgi:hypothetical protein